MSSFKPASAPNNYSRQTVNYVKLFLLAVQIPLLIILGFDGKELSELNKLRPFPSLSKAPPQLFEYILTADMGPFGSCPLLL